MGSRVMQNLYTLAGEPKDLRLALVLGGLILRTYGSQLKAKELIEEELKS